MNIYAVWMNFDDENKKRDKVLFQLYLLFHIRILSTDGIFITLGKKTTDNYFTLKLKLFYLMLCRTFLVALSIVVHHFL